jgi:death-on-curing protein
VINLNHILEVHSKSITLDRELNPTDYARGERCIGLLSIMLEYKLHEDNSVFRNAAMVLQTIAAEHPFFNGNKRTAIATAMVILANEGYKLSINEKDRIQFIIDVATPQKDVSLEAIEKWIAEKAVKVR